MNLREQEYVLAIANYQTLKGAAEFLNVSPPTLSVFLSLRWSTHLVCPCSTALERNLCLPR